MMDKNLEKIVSFLEKHHVMSLATQGDNGLSVCSLFYAFLQEKHSFVVASSDDTTHIQNILKTPTIAGSVVLETKTVGKIQGLQFRGTFFKLEDETLKRLYFKTFPFALAMRLQLWQIKIDYFKMTDNSFGFGKKIIWKDSSVV